MVECGDLTITKTIWNGLLYYLGKEQCSSENICETTLLQAQETFAFSLAQVMKERKRGKVLVC